MPNKFVSTLSDYKLQYLKDFEQRNKHLTIPLESLFKVVKSTLSQLHEPITWEELKCYYDGSHWKEIKFPLEEDTKLANKELLQQNKSIMEKKESIDLNSLSNFQTDYLKKLYTKYEDLTTLSNHTIFAMNEEALNKLEEPIHLMGFLSFFDYHRKSKISRHSQEEGWVIEVLKEVEEQRKLKKCREVLINDYLEIINKNWQSRKFNHYRSIVYKLLCNHPSLISNINNYNVLGRALQETFGTLSNVHLPYYCLSKGIYNNPLDYDYIELRRCLIEKHGSSLMHVINKSLDVFYSSSKNKWKGKKLDSPEVILLKMELADLASFPHLLASSKKRYREIIIKLFPTGSSIFKKNEPTPFKKIKAEFIIECQNYHKIIYRYLNKRILLDHDLMLR